jgi:hypothetical protein
MAGGRSSRQLSAIEEIAALNQVPRFFFPSYEIQAHHIRNRTAERVGSFLRSPSRHFSLVAAI